MKRRNSFIFASALLSFSLTSCTFTDYFIKKNYAILNVSSSINLTVGETYQIDYLLDGEDDIVLFKSNDESIASVNELGLITALKKGETIISLFAKNNEKIKASIRVIVTERIDQHLSLGNYKIKEGITDLSFFEGYPWINTSIEGVLNKIEKPSEKDDFWANCNYDLLKELEVPEDQTSVGGDINASKTLTQKHLDTLYNENPTIISIMDMIEKGSGSTIQSEVNHILNMSHDELHDYLNSEEIFTGNSRLFGISHVEGNEEYRIDIDGYSNKPGLFYYAVYSYWYDRLDPFTSALLEIAEAEGFQVDNLEDKIASAIDAYNRWNNNLPEDYKLETSTTVGEFAIADTNGIDFKSILNDIGLEDSQKIVYTKDVIEWTSYLKDESDETIKNVLAIGKILDSRYFVGASKFKELYLNTYNKLYLTTISKDFDEGATLEEVSKYILETNFVDILNRFYIEEFIKPESRNGVKELIENIISEYRVMLSQELWLSNETIAKAIEKLDAMSYTVFYEDEYLDCDRYVVNSNDIFNMYSSYKNYYVERIAEGNIFDDALHKRPYYFANASYAASCNNFMIYHGLVSSYIDKEMTKEELYGRLGLTIGHEISHGFDDTGAKYDKDGKRKSWWTSEDKNKFNEKVANLQSYVQNKTRSINKYPNIGSLVSGEVIADMGGVKVCLGVASKIDNFDYKTYFSNIAYFFSWVYSYKAAVDQVLTNPHPTPYLRTNLTLAQFDQFDSVYDVKQGDGMYIAPEERIAIW